MSIEWAGALSAGTTARLVTTTRWARPGRGIGASAVSVSGVAWGNGVGSITPNSNGSRSRRGIVGWVDP